MSPPPARPYRHTVGPRPLTVGYLAKLASRSPKASAYAQCLIEDLPAEERDGCRRAFNSQVRSEYRELLEERRRLLRIVKKRMTDDQRRHQLRARQVARRALSQLRSASQNSSAACNQGRTRRRPTTNTRTRRSSSRRSPDDPPGDQPSSQPGAPKELRHISDVLADWLEAKARRPCNEPDLPVAVRAWSPSLSPAEMLDAFGLLPDGRAAGMLGEPRPQNRMRALECVQRLPGGRRR